MISVREESLSGCYRRNSHGTPDKGDYWLWRRLSEPLSPFWCGLSGAPGCVTWELILDGYSESSYSATPRFAASWLPQGFRMVRYYGFLSPVKRRLLEEVVYAITETVRKTAIQIRWRGMYQRLLKVDPLKCILCGSQMRFTGLKRGYRLAELVLIHERLARQQVCG